MHDRTRNRTRLSCALPVLALSALIAGCSTTPDADAEAARLRQHTYQEALADSTDAIRDGDLECAEAHLELARENAATPPQRSKVISLEHLLAGAESLMTGDAPAAGAAWSQIEDPELAGEVRAKAERMGLRVPVRTVRQTNEDEDAR